MKNMFLKDSAVSNTVSKDNLFCRITGSKKFKAIYKNKTLYLFILPAFIYILVFCYWPMYGIQIAFRDFNPAKGIWDSTWVGLKHMTRFLESYSFTTLLKNTLALSVYQLIVGFPFPIILAIVINYIRSGRFKKIAQTISYAPHFISVVILTGMLFVFFGPTNGLVNIVIRSLGGEGIDFIGDPSYFRNLYVWSGVWQTTGFSSVIYIATLAGVSKELHEAATIDGASPYQRIWYIDIPCIMPTAIIILIMSAGRVMSIGFEKVYLMQTAPNLSVSEIINTYEYKVGITGGQYSYASAIGLFNNAVNFIVLVIINKIANKTSDSGLW